MTTVKARAGRSLLTRTWGRLLAIAVLAALAGLSGIEPGRAAIAQPESGRSGLVVRYEDGRVETRCVELQAAEVTGADLLAQSGMDTIVDASSGLGITVCRIEGQGCDYPAQPCFCQCSGTGPCAYWNYFYRDAAESEWTYAPLGALLRKVKDGSVDAWVWGDGAPPDRDLTFEAVCPQAAPTALAVATAAPAAAPSVVAQARATAGPLPVVETAGGLAPAATSVSVPASSTANPSSYLLFGAMALGLLAATAALWLRGRQR
jgi:hypothetical protein